MNETPYSELRPLVRAAVLYSESRRKKHYQKLLRVQAAHRSQVKYAERLKAENERLKNTEIRLRNIIETLSNPLVAAKTRVRGLECFLRALKDSLQNVVRNTSDNYAKNQIDGMFVVIDETLKGDS